MEPSNRRSKPYKEGDVLSLNVKGEKSESSLLKVTVEKLFQRPTSSVSMVVRVQDSPKPYVLKLFDRRQSSTFRHRNFVNHDWSEDFERTYLDFARSTSGIAFYNRLIDSDVDYMQSWALVEEEMLLQTRCYDFHKAEVEAYDVLADMQGISIPELEHVVSIQNSDEPDLQEFTEVRGLLLEYIDGFCLEDLTDHAPKEVWDKVIRDAVDLVNSIDDHGLLNRNVLPENVLVRRTSDNAEEYKPIIHDFKHTRLRGEDESERDWMEERYWAEVDWSIGFEMRKILEQKGETFNWKPTGRYGIRFMNDGGIILMGDEDQGIIRYGQELKDYLGQREKFWLQDLCEDWDLDEGLLNHVQSLLLRS